MNKIGVIVPFLLLVAAFCCVGQVHAQQTGFTYEGRLTDAGAPATGLYDFQFSLWDSGVGGSLVAGGITVAPLGVTNGLFVTSLNFGAGVFTGGARWLELRVRTNGSAAAYMTLSPRQSINAMPYALYAMTPAGPLGPQGLKGDKGDKGDQGIQGIQGLQGLTGLPGTTTATDITTGTLADARLSARVAFKDTDIAPLNAAVLGVNNSVNSSSNALAARLMATNALLVARVADLEGRLTTVSNLVNESVPSGSVVMSAEAVDAKLISKGYAHFSVIDAPVWQNGSTLDIPAARSRLSAVWTGEEMVVWGGFLGEGVLAGTGGRYLEAVDVWTGIPTFGAPVARNSHTAVWTGSEMIVWGGFTVLGATNSGGKFSTALQQWTAVSTTNAPAARADHCAVWTGSRMIVWGGRTGGYFADGGIYNPATDSWVTTTGGGPSARFGATAVWTGSLSRMVVWGGENDSGPLDTGMRLPINLNGTAAVWQSVSSVNAPVARSHHSAIWTGSRMIVWGGQQGEGLLDSGASYDPVADTWTTISSLNAPSGRASHVAVWTGTEMIVFGGTDASGEIATGGAYDPAFNKWRALNGRGGPIARQGARAVWSGSELIVFGGEANGQVVGSLQRLNPQPAWHLFRKP